MNRSPRAADGQVAVLLVGAPMAIVVGSTAINRGADRCVAWSVYAALKAVLTGSGDRWTTVQELADDLESR